MIDTAWNVSIVSIKKLMEKVTSFIFVESIE